MNKLLIFVSIFFATSMFFACDKTPTAQELLEEEKKAINRFIVDNEFIITGDPAGMYEDNVYYKTPEGVYIHVIDSGYVNGDKAEYNTEVVARYESVFYFKTDTVKTTGNMSVSNPPYVFLFGNSSTYNNGDLPDFVCDGWMIGLSFVRDNARINVIVPSEFQSDSRKSSFSPLFFENLYFRFK